MFYYFLVRIELDGESYCDVVASSQRFDVRNESGLDSILKLFALKESHLSQGSLQEAYREVRAIYDSLENSPEAPARLYMYSAHELNLLPIVELDERAWEQDRKNHELITAIELLEQHAKSKKQAKGSDEQNRQEVFPSSERIIHAIAVITPVLDWKRRLDHAMSELQEHTKYVSSLKKQKAKELRNLSSRQIEKEQADKSGWSSGPIQQQIGHIERKIHSLNAQIAALVDEPGYGSRLLQLEQTIQELEAEGETASYITYAARAEKALAPPPYLPLLLRTSRRV